MKKIQSAKNVILTVVAWNFCSIKNKLIRDLIPDQLKNIFRKKPIINIIIKYNDLFYMMMIGKRPDILSLIETHLK